MDFIQSGVYFLFGTLEITGENESYIGQSDVRKTGEGILVRSYQHKRHPDKNYSTEAVVLTTSNNSFGQKKLVTLKIDL